MQLPHNLHLQTSGNSPKSSPKISARAAAQAIIGANKIKKSKKQKRNKSPEFIVLNTSPKKTQSQEREIKEAHDRVMGPDKKVKF